MKKSAFFLWLTGFLLAGGFISLRFFEPLANHVPFFLIINSILFFIYFVSIVWIKKNANLEMPLQGAGLVIGFSLFFRLTLLGTTPSLSDDIYRYVWDGRVQQAGINPYLYPPSDSNLNFLRDDQHRFINHPDLRTVYPPMAQYVYRLGVKLSPTVFSQKVIFVLFDVGCLLIILALLKIRGQSPLWALVYGWNPLCVVEFSGSGHNDSLMLFFLMLGFLFFQKNKSAKGMISLALASLSKFIPLISLPWLFVQKGRRFMVLFVLAFLLGALPFLGGFLDFFNKGVNAFSGLQTYTKDWFFNPSLYSLIGMVFPNPMFRKVLLGFLLILASFFWAQRTKKDGVLYFLGAVLALLFCSPVVHPWYVTWILPFLCFFPLWSGLFWSWLVSFTYVVLIRYHSEGVWVLSPIIPWLEYAVVGGILGLEIFRGFKREGAGRVKKLTTNSIATPFSKSTKLKPTVIIPALNEEKALPLVIAELPHTPGLEVIVVDNGSTDQTARIAATAGARVLMEPLRGYGRAVQTGLAHLRLDSDVVVILDGDHSDFPEELPRLLAPLESGEADMVIGTRTQAALPGSLMPQQRFGNWLTCLLIRVLFGEHFTDMGPFRAIRRSALEQMKLEDKNFGWNVEMQIKALELGLTIVEVPVQYRPRIGKSKISGTLRGSFNAGRIILWSVYKYGWRS